MTNSASRRIGPYEIDRELGRGGMGVVYFGRDTRLDRDVAIKALPEHLAKDPNRLARFEREAKTLAQLNHPNVAGIYGVEEHENARYLVLEYVEGDTLADLVKRGPLPVHDTLEIAAQIAAGVEAAHEAGVIHRDLKPGNVVVTPDGRAKVLDFGLARADETASSISAAPSDPTITSPAVHSPTIPGVILGTAAYMSPEQARGRRLDKRTDIWSFGVVLLECLTAQAPFGGETVSDAIAEVLKKEPDWDALPEDTPQSVRLLLRRCLVKDPTKRLRDIGDARLELESAIADPLGSSLTLTTAVDGTRRRGAGAVTLLAIIVAAIGFTLGRAGYKTQQNATPEVRKFDLGIRSYEPNRGIAISPDGRKIVYSAGRKLWVREIDKLEPREIPGTDDATQPIWSPDGNRIAYAVEDRVWHVSWRGGSPTAVGTLPAAVLPVGGISWTDDDRVLIATGNTGLHELSARGGDARWLLEVDPQKEEDFHHAAALPGGRGVLFTVHGKDGAVDQIDLWTPDARKTILEIRGERFDNPVYSNTGHILYSRATTTPGIWALPFSTESLEVTGEPFLVASDATRPAVSKGGALVFCRGTMSVDHRLVWVDRSGRVLGQVGQPQPVMQYPAISPDGTRVAVSANEPGERNIWIHDIARGTKTRLTFEEESPGLPTWIHKSNRIAYSTGSGGRSAARIRNADGSDDGVELPIMRPRSCSSDGKFLLYSVEDGPASDDIAYLPLEEGGKPTPLVATDKEERHPVISPDGTLVAYEYRDRGSEEIFLTTFPGGSGRWQVSNKSGASPRWSPKGDELFYIEVSTFTLMRVAIEREPQLRLGTPEKLFSGLTPGVALYADYDVARDGEKFIMVQINDPNATNRGIAIVENWYEEFRK